MLRRPSSWWRALAAAVFCRCTRRRTVPVTSRPPTVRRSTRPTRIISLSPSATEDLFAVGAGKQVVAVDDQSDYPKQAPRTKLSGFTPNAEAIAAYNPDLVVVSNDGGIVASLEKLGITVLLEPAPDNVAQAYDEIRQLGQATGHAKQATTVVRSMQKSADDAHPQRAEGLEASQDLPRARPDVLLGDVGDVHRPDLQAVRLPEHRGRRRLDALRVPAALGGVHRRRRIRTSSCSPTRSAAGRTPRRSRAAGLERGWSASGITA